MFGLLTNSSEEAKLTNLPRLCCIRTIFCVVIKTKSDTNPPRRTGVEIALTCTCDARGSNV